MLTSLANLGLGGKPEAYAKLADEMAAKSPNQNRAPLIVLGIFVLGLLAFLVLLQSSNIWKSFSVDTASDTLLLYGLSSLNVAAFVIFGFIFLRSLVKLMRERRTLQLGSKIKSRLFFYFALVSLLPIIAMAVFSYLFLNRALDRWFTQIPEDVVREAEKIQNKSNSDQYARLEQTGKMLAVLLDDRAAISKSELNELASSGGLAFVEVLDHENSVIASSSVGTDLRDSEEFKVLARNDLDAEVLRDGVGIDVAVTDLPGNRRLAVGLDLRRSEGVNQMFETALTEFDRLKQQQVTVRQIGFLTLGVLTFLLIFASSWTAFYIARGLTGPIKALAEGAERIAQGDLGHRVDVLAEDELALLVWTFNEMSAKLEANAAEITERRRYIETVLLSLPTGVISIDSENRITTINPAAKSILRLEQGDYGGVDLHVVLEPSDRESIERLITRSRRIGFAADNTKFAASELNGDGLPVSITATALPEDRGVVLVIEDLSELIAAQRASAWQEVARRMAHEIKNPLTPIQLSAERIARRFTSQPAIAGSAPSFTDDGNARVVAEGTNTILREVHSLKSMVDEFSRFARLPNARLELWDVNEVIRETSSLYRDRLEDLTIETQLADDVPPIMLDDEQLKRVFVNLIDNAIEAPGSESRRIRIVSRLDTARDLVVIEVSDNGAGIDPGDYQKLFQPYFSTKDRGTGLGLPIVQRIISEHNGKIRAAANGPHGARFIIELPVPSGT